VPEEEGDEASGSEGFGVNAVARQAGCDKQLIYRYFGGLGGLVDAIGKDIASWWEDRLRPLDALGRPDSYAELMQRLGLSVLQALRDDDLMRQIVMWELTSNSDQVQRLAQARSVALHYWMQRTRGDLIPPPGVDAAATNAVILAAIQHLVLAGSNAGAFAGVPLTAEADWERMRGTLRRIISAVYA
jgi:AcrR family transcriptional regulator